MSSSMSAREVALKWIELYNDGTPDFYGSDRFLDLYAPDAEWREMPTRRFPPGRTGSIDVLRGAVVASQGTARNRHLTLRELVAEDNRAALTYTYEATVASDAFASLGLARNDTLRLEVAQVIETADGKIQRSTEYVIFVPPETRS